MKYLFCAFHLISVLGCGETFNGSELKVERIKPSPELEYEILKIDTFLKNLVQEVKLSLFVKGNVSNTIQIEKIFEEVYNEFEKKGQLKENSDSTEYIILLYPSKRIAEYEGTFLAKYYISEDFNKYVNHFDRTALKGYWMDVAPELTKFDIKFKQLDNQLREKSTSACEIYFEYKDLERTNKSKLIALGKQISNNQYYWNLMEEVKDSLANKYNLPKESISMVINYSAIRCK